ncbi:4-demethylwyosine synthase TYW1 [Candidatus Woesearchaeota archaeon]|nr:4-demethylwyosine synthase TYW1 [Candidatus Woesearchaeota archaeon]
MDPQLKQTLENQQYGIAGNHSAVKICTWTKKSLLDKGFCYKEKFYGIRSHLCCQMTPSVGHCVNNCVYCWRTVEHSMSNDFEPLDQPEVIIKNCVKNQRILLSGFGGNKDVNMEKLKEAQNPEHFAISLSGEPTMYPKLNQLIRLLHNKSKTTFLVTNGMFPEVIKNLEMPTQLYISLSAPNKELFKKINQPLLNNGWERLNKSLDILCDLNGSTRTTLRLTMISNLNMIHPEQWAALIEKASPKFVEVKAYMFVGSSRQRRTISDMPYHEDIVEFSKELEKYGSYKVIDQKKESRVVLMMEQDSRDRIMDFPKRKI